MLPYLVIQVYLLSFRDPEYNTQYTGREPFNYLCQIGVVVHVAGSTRFSLIYIYKIISVRIHTTNYISITTFLSRFTIIYLQNS